MTKTIGFRVNESEQQVIEDAISTHQCNDVKSLVFTLLAHNSNKAAISENDLVITFPDAKQKQGFLALVRLNKIEPFELLKRLINEVKKGALFTTIKGL